MKFKLLFTLALLFTISIYSTAAQSQNKTNKTNEKFVKYLDNVNAPLTSDELSKLKEVYADKLDEYVLNRPQYLKYLKHLLRNRIQIVAKPDLIQHKEKYQLLSEVGLFNDYNKSLTVDKNYNPQSFNVLKYNVRIHGNGSSLYRIDNTNYFIIIKSQHQ